jgi:hypothetical protein
MYVTACTIRMINFVNSHGSGFATPQTDGSVYIYSYATFQGRLTIIRDRAETMADCRRILGY